MTCAGEEEHVRQLLELLQRDVGGAEADARAEAESAEPWSVVPAGAGLWAVIAAGEEDPEVLLRSQELALLVAAVLPSTGRAPLVEVGRQAGKDGYPLLSPSGEILGFVRHFRPELAAGLHVVEHVRRTPLALSRLLRAAAPISLSRATRMMLAEGAGGAGRPAHAIHRRQPDSQAEEDR